MNKQHKEDDLSAKELEVIEFLTGITRRNLDPSTLQTMFSTQSIQEQIKIYRQMLSQTCNGQGSSQSSSSGRSPSSFVSNDDIPDPIVTFNYVSPHSVPPTILKSCNGQGSSQSSSGSSPARAPSVPPTILKSLKQTEKFKLQNRSTFINMRENISPPSSLDANSENWEIASPTPTTKAMEWVGYSIYNNLPQLVQVEFDKLLQESHEMKVKVIEELNRKNPINYDYNPKKSRLRSNYGDAIVAAERTRNNIASRRSRQRKKFQNKIVQYCVNYDMDENALMEKQENWLQGIIKSLEYKLCENKDGIDKMKVLRAKSGLK